MCGVYRTMRVTNCNKYDFFYYFYFYCDEALSLRSKISKVNLLCGALETKERDSMKPATLFLRHLRHGQHKPNTPVSITGLRNYLTTKHCRNEGKNMPVVMKENPGLGKVQKDPWQPQKDPAGSALVYYWNTDTNETTALGAPKPLHWIEVRDPNGSELSYWWAPESNQTTALGAPRPAATQQYNNTGRGNPFTGGIAGGGGQPVTFGQSMKSYFIMGGAMTCGMILVRVVLGV